MKKSFPYLPGLLLVSSAIFTSCQKDELLVLENEGDVENASARSANCIATGFNVSYSDGNKMVFKTQFAGSVDRPKRISAGVFQGGTITQNIELDIKRAGKTITIYKSGSATDAVLIVTLNNNNRPVSAVAGNSPDDNFLPTNFTYSGDKLSSMNILLAGNYTTSNFVYSNGNISSIEDVSSAGLVAGKIQYEYNLNARAVKQLYLEETRGFSWNTFTLLQYLGYFPELDPIHLRTRTKVMWGNNYVALDANLVNHQVENGKLVRYDVTYQGSEVNIPHYIEWDCGVGNNDNASTGNN
ncbi:MAG TPA: hypothetical protein VGD17_02130 [Chitinophagaceae bacterium]